MTYTIQFNLSVTDSDDDSYLYLSHVWVTCDAPTPSESTPEEPTPEEPTPEEPTPEESTPEEDDDGEGGDDSSSTYISSSILLILAFVGLILVWMKEWRNTNKKVKYIKNR